MHRPAGLNSIRTHVPCRVQGFRMGMQGSGSGRRATPLPSVPGGGTRAASGQPFRVLVVDDDEALVRQWQRLLKEDAVLVPVPTFQGGWQRTERDAWRADPFDHIFLDLSLPDGDGSNLLPRIN